VTSDWTLFPRLLAAIDDGIQRGLHSAVQVCIAHQGCELLNSASGDAAPGRPLTRDHVMPWRSAGKPLTAWLVVKTMLVDELTLETPLSECLPESQNTDKATVTIGQLLTHQSGFPDTDTGWPHHSWDESVRRVLNTPATRPAGTAAYHPQSSWFLLAEFLRRRIPVAKDRDFARVLESEVLHPLGMQESSCGIDVTARSFMPERMPTIYERVNGALQASPWMQAPWLTQPSAGGNVRGPVRDLVTFYEFLRRALAGELTEIDHQAAEWMTRRHRSGQFDQTLQHVVDFGLGVICDSNHTGAATVPYGFGRHCSKQTFGHGGSQCAMGFCDPVHELTVAWAANGFCGEGQHQRRNRAINEAIYADLGLV
jgi:CubicO group peptidase (beta-lactamase class C family)